MKKTSGSYMISFLLAMALWCLPLWAEAAQPILVEGAMACETDWLIGKLENPSEQRIGRTLLPLEWCLTFPKRRWAF